MGSTGISAGWPCLKKERMVKNKGSREMNIDGIQEKTLEQRQSHMTPSIRRV